MYPHFRLSFLKYLKKLVVLTLVLFLVGCGGSATSQTKVPQVVQAILSDPKTFNYVLSQEVPNVFGPIYESLIREHPITGEYEPSLAKSWEISEDKLKITFTLREGLKWSDGKPLTVDDVIFTFNDIYLNEKIPYNGRDGLRVGQSQSFPIVKKLNDNQIEFSISEPFAPFLGGIGSSPILPAHALKKGVEIKDDKPVISSMWGVDTPPGEIIVNGPYQLAGYATSQRVIFKDNPHYWRKDNQGQQLPHIKRLVWQIVESTDTSFLQFRSGSLDSLSVSPEFFSLLKKEEKRGNFTIYNGGPAYGTNFISFNLNKGIRDGKPLVDPVKSAWFNNVNFRRAMAHAIDRQRMINNIFRGLGEPQNSPISVQSPFYDKTLIGYEYNLEKAKELLLQEGFKYDDKNQLLDSQGNRVRFSLITNAGNKIREGMGSQIKEDLSKIGIKVDYTPIAFSVLVDKLSNSLDWECHLLGLTGGNEPNDGANVWNTDGNLHVFNQKPQPGEKPITGRVIAPWEQEIADLYIEGARELDIEKRKAIYAQSQRLTEEYLPFIYLVNTYSLAAVRNRFQGIEFSALGGAFWNMEELKLSE